MIENTSVLDVDFAAESGHYLDNSAKVSNVLKNSNLQQKELSRSIAKFLYNSGHEKYGDRLSSCGQEWLPFSDTAGHQIWGLKACGLPFCPTCGKPGSSLNQKRSNRVKDILLGFPCIGHFVFTLPKEVSASLPGSDKINRLYKLVWEILRDWLNAEAAVIVLHFCGDKKDDLHLHFDCSFPVLHTNGDCWYPPRVLDMARAQWTAGINAVFKTFYLDSVGHYNFVNTLAQEHHLIKYVTRSTMSAEKFVELSEAEKNYCLVQGKKKIIRYYGEFVGKKKIKFLAKYKVDVERTPGDLISRRICPICNEKMKLAKDKESGKVKRAFLDDIPLTQLERYDGHTFVDKQIMAFLRSQEANKPKPPGSLLEAICQQETLDIIEKAKNEVLDETCEETFEETLLAKW